MASKKRLLPAQQQTINPDELFARLDALQPAGDQAQSMEPRGTMRAIGDTAVQFGKGAVTGVRMMSDVFGADNAVSGGLRSADEALNGLLSATAKQDQEQVAAIMQEAEGKGWMDQIGIGLRAAGVAPGALLAQAAGTAVPTLAAAAMTGGAGPMATAARFAAPAVMGGIQGMGATKGAIYETTKQELMKAGASPEEAEARAIEQQSYGGDSSGQIALGTGLGVVAGGLGIERTMAGLRGGVAKAAPGMMTRMGTGAVTEAVPEFAQGGQEKYATNSALNNEGFQVDPMSGVVANATMEGVAGAGMGAAFGIPRPDVPPAPPPAPAAPPAPTAPPPGPMQRAAAAGMPSNFTATPAATLGAQTPVNAGTGFNAGNLPNGMGAPAQIMDQAELDALVESERRDQQVMLAQMDMERQKQAEIDAAFEAKPALDAQQRAAELDAPSVMAQAFQRAQTPAEQPAAAEQVPVAPVESVAQVPEPRIVERTPDMPAPMPRELAELQVDMDGGEVVRTQNRNGKWAYHVVKPAPPAAPPPATDIMNKLGKPFTNLFAAKTEAGRRGAGFEPVKVGEGAYVVRQVSQPINQGASDGNQNTQTSQTPEALLTGADPQPTEQPLAQATQTQPQQTQREEAPKAFDQLPDLTPDQREVLDQAIARDLEKQYQQDLVTELKRKRGLLPAEKDNELKRSPFKNFLITHGVSDKPADVVGEGNAFRANNIIPTLFRKNGIGMDELVNRAAEAGFITQEEADNGEGVPKLVEMIRSEVAGTKRHLPLDMQDESAEQRAEQNLRLEVEADAQELGLVYDPDMDTRRLQGMVMRVRDRVKRAPKNGLLKPDRILRNARDAATRIEQKRAQFAQQLAEFEAATLAEQDALLDLFTDEDGNSQTIVRTVDAQAISQWLKDNPTQAGQDGTDTRSTEDVRQDQAPAPSVATEGAGDGGQAGPGTQQGSAQGQGEEGLTAPTRADVLAQQAAREAEEQRKKDGGDKPIQRKVTADQVDLFNPQGSIFDAPAQTPAETTPAAPKAKADDAENKTLTPTQSAKLQEAHKALGRDVTRKQVQSMRDRVAGEIESGKANNGGVMVSLKPAAIAQRKEQLTRLDADLALFDVPAEPAQPAAESKPAGKYKGPADVSTRAGQMELANRAGRIASLKAMNGQLRQIAPNEAWADANIESANDLDALQDQISAALVAAGKGTAAAAKVPDALRTELEEMSGAELKAVFAEMNLAGKILTHDERVDMLMAEDAAEVRAAIGKAQPAAQEPAKLAKATTDAAAAVPKAVQDQVQWAVTQLRDIEGALESVLRARGDGHILALEVKDQEVKQVRPNEILTEFREHAKKNGVDAEAVIDALGGVPDLARFSKEESTQIDGDLRGYAYALVKNGQIITSGSFPSKANMAADDTANVSHFKKEADAKGADLYIGGYPGADAWTSPDGLIFGMTFAELDAKQQRRTVPASLKGKMPTDAVVVYEGQSKPVEPATEARDEPIPAVTEAQARKQFEWRNMGQKDGTKSHRLYWFEREADKGTGQAMGYGEVSLYPGASGWKIEDGDGTSYKSLADAKAAAIDEAMPRLLKNGYVLKPAQAAAAILDAANITGKERVDAIKDVKKGDITPAELEAAYPEKPAASTPKPAKIEDSGQVLEGARKLYAKNYAAKMDEGMGMDTAAVPLSKSWPEPDYQRLIDEGADPWAVAFAHAARDELPSKPSSSWKLKGWVQKVEILREFASKVLAGDGAFTFQNVREKAIANNLGDWLNKIDLYQAVGHAKSLKGMTFSVGEYGMYGGQTFNPPKKLWSINVPSANGSSWSNGNWGTDLVVADTKEEAIEKFKAWHAAQGEAAPAETKAISFDIYSYRSKPNVFVVGKRISSKKSVDLKEFATAKEARAYIAENQAELEKLLAEAKFEPNERRESNSPRVGADHRNGADVTSEQFRETFGFRGEQFGASMPQGERQSNMNQAYDALMDLAGVIGVPPKALSLNGELGLAFGSRGTGGKNPAAAHYERDTTGKVTRNRVVINLTRKNGAGSLGHEWFHAVDNYFARMRGEKGGMLTEKPYERGDGVRLEMVAAFKQLMAAIQTSGIKERSKNLDKKRVKDYWSTGLEMAARSFESYIIAKLQDNNGSNDYLANIVPESLYAMQASYPYPVMGEMPAIRAAFDDFFKTVQTKETDTGVAMFSARDSAPEKQLALNQIERLVQSALRGMKNAPTVRVVASPEAIGLRSPVDTVPSGVTMTNGDIYVFQSGIGSVLDVDLVVFHEVFHKGLQNVLSKADYVTAMKQIADNDAKVREYAGVWSDSKAGKAALDEMAEKLSGKELADQYEALATEEGLAMIAEDLKARREMGTKTMQTRRLVTWLAKVADKLGMARLANGLRSLSYSDAERFVISTIGKAGGVGQGGARFRSLDSTLSTAANNVRNVKLPADYVVGDFFNSAPGKLGIWHKTVGTQYHLAQKSPAFKRVFDSVQTFLNDVSYYATEAADMAPNILPKLETWKDIGKKPVSAEDTKAFSRPVFEGTLTWGRDESGKPVRQAVLEAQAAKLTTEQKGQRLLRGKHISESVLKMWQGLPIDQYEAMIESKYERDMLKPGIVFTPAELKQLFNLTPNQIKLYQEFRSATDRSLTNLAIADMLRFGGDDVFPIREAVLESANVQQAAETLSKYLLSLTDIDPARTEVLTDTANKMLDKGDKAKDLIDRGYAPLSRFGQYTLDVVDASGERVYFGMFESKWEAARMNRQMREAYPDATINQGTVSEQAYKMFAGVSPETLALFGDMLGLEQQGDGASAQAFQEYLKLAKSNRSAMKRLIQRKGIAGFNEDAGRVLAGFVYSNARQTSTSLHMGEMTNAANDMPQQQGEIKDAAVKLVDYIKNPQEEAQAFRGLLFAQYIGGSVASAMVNMTQPLTMTLPWLSQYGGAAKSAKQMTAAMKDSLKKLTGDAKLDAAIRRAEEDGTVSPQEVHQLMQQSQGKGALRSGDGTRLGDMAAKGSNALSRFSLGWGKLFSTAEQFNRRVTFIAAYRTAVEQKIPDPDAFARKAIAETQGIYNKGNKPQWARGAIGGTLFTFKQYSVAYVEMLQRMSKSGTEGKKAALLALGILFLLSGASGLPGSDDLDDIISGAMQSMGYNFDSKQRRQEFFVELFGEGGAQFMERGVSGLPGVPIDVSGRMGLGNLIPGTGIFQKKIDHSRDVAEVFGPAGDLVKRGYDAAGKLLKGEVLGYKGAIATASPKAMQNLYQAYDMANMGMYRDMNGKKVLDTDTGDWMVKAAGFQPNDVARVQDASFDVQRMIGVNKMRESEIADKWAKGLFEKDPQKVAAARLELQEWNTDNPSSPIRINFRQIQQRLKAMNATKAERLAKTAPRELRAAVKAELAIQ